MKVRRFRISRRSVTWLAASAMLAIAPMISAQVTVSINVSGDALPGATLTATATVSDGSAIQSISWRQTAGVPASLVGADTSTLTLTLAASDVYKTHLIDVLREPPIAADDFPPYVPVPEGEFVGGLQNRFQLVGASHHGLADAAAVGIAVDVVTASGSYTAKKAIVTTLPWKASTGLTNVAVGQRLLFQGKEQDTYNWALIPAAGSSATLSGASTRNPEFTPDVAGTYRLTVTDKAANESKTMTIYAGTWKGIITGKDAAGLPVADASCTTCHDGNTAPDKFLPWAQTGHSEIFKDNLDTSTHYGSSCFGCHTVGFDTGLANGGFDDAADYPAFLNSGMLNVPGDNWTRMLAEYPAAARLANIQCENCHGPQTSSAHMKADGSRTSLASDVCASCHGEPTRHARYQQWQISGHANYELAQEEGTNASCSRCHSANGFIEWSKVLTGQVAGDPLANITVTWTEEDVHPQTCATCHDPHAMGETSGEPNTAAVRIYGDTPPLLAGFTATDVGKGAICITCHNTRRGLINDANFNPSNLTRAPHLGAQGDVLMGQNAYFVNVGQRSYHSKIANTCVACHMNETAPPDPLSNNKSGTNHTFFADRNICANCHSVITTESVQEATHQGLEALKESLEEGILAVMGRQIAAGKTIDLGGVATISNLNQIASLEFAESHGRQGVMVHFADGTETEEAIGMNNVKVVTTAGTSVGLYDLADPALGKAGWNYLLLETDGSLGVHNPGWVREILNTSRFAVEIATSGGSGGTGGGGGTGVAGGACDNQQYWTEIAAHSPGLAGSQWRTDVVARNTSDSGASIEFTLHAASGTYSSSYQIAAGAQGVFEDVVGMMGLEEKGSLEICGNQRLEIVSRIFNQSDSGTFGQFMDGRAFVDGMADGDTARLLGLRQKTDLFRTNISVTNTGAEAAEVTIVLYATNGTRLHEYNLAVGSGQVVQDLEPFARRAALPDLGWGFATVEVTSGFGVFASASVVDSVTNDATTIPMKR